MRWTRQFATAMIGLTMATGVAQAQTTVNYSTTGSFIGLCSGLSCSLGGMTIDFNPLTTNTITLDANNSHFSFLSFGEFRVSGTRATQQSFAGVSFALHVTQNLPTPGATQILTGQFTGGIDGTSSNLRWSPTPTTWSIASNPNIAYSINNPISLQAPTSNQGVTSIQGDIRTSVVPEPGTYALLASGMLCVFFAARRRAAA